MQFANDITKLTLASSAKLREITAPVGKCFYDDDERELARRELESRLPDNSLENKRDQIAELEEVVSFLEKDATEESRDHDATKG